MEHTNRFRSDLIVARCMTLMASQWPVLGAFIPDAWRLKSCILLSPLNYMPLAMRRGS
jgi:hypothetical protein